MPVTWAGLFACVLATATAAAGVAHASGRDFLDETLVATPFERALNAGLGAEARVDRDYRIQGWFPIEAEAGVTTGWLLEAKLDGVARGQGLEVATWAFESRLLLARQPRAPLSLAIAGSYEVETRAAKRPSLERIVELRVVATRVFGGSLLVTANAGIAQTRVPVIRHGTTTAFGVRYPEKGPLTPGVELRRDCLDDETRAGPYLRIAFPGGIRLRLGGTAGIHSRPYRFIVRAMVEVEP